jgi:hypothetical protein
MQNHMPFIVGAVIGDVGAVIGDDSINSGRCEMASVLHRRVTIPLWAMAFFAVALTAPPPATLSLIAVFALTAIAFTTPGLVPWLRCSWSVASVRSQRLRHHGSAAISMAAAPAVPALDERDRNTPQDALDLVRMDDDGGWQIARPRS